MCFVWTWCPRKLKYTLRKLMAKDDVFWTRCKGVFNIVNFEHPSIGTTSIIHRFISTDKCRHRLLGRNPRTGAGSLQNSRCWRDTWQNSPGFARIQGKLFVGIGTWPLAPMLHNHLVNCWIPVVRLDVVPRTETSALFHLLDDGDGEATNLLEKSIGVGEIFGSKWIENLVDELNPWVL